MGTWWDSCLPPRWWPESCYTGSGDSSRIPGMRKRFKYWREVGFTIVALLILLNMTATVLAYIAG